MAEKKPAKAAAKAHRTFYIGTGRRKTAVARVRITEGKGQVIINGKPLEDYFHEDKDRAAVLGPLKITDQLTRVDVFVNAKGGGVTGQAGLYFLGLPWLHTWGSGRFSGVARDAEFLADRIEQSVTVMA